VTGDDQEKSDVAITVTMGPGHREPAPGAENLEHVLPADPVIA